MEIKKIPPFRMISDQLKQDISDHQLNENDKLPSERELMERFHVSRMTIRQAVDHLVKEGVLYRIKGRGAFVSPLIFHRGATIKSFSSMMAERGIDVNNELLELSRMQAPKQIQEQYGICGEVYHLTRVRYANGAAVAYETLYVPCDKFPGFEHYSFEQDSLYRIFEEEYHQQFLFNKEEISAVHVSKEIAEKLYQKRSGFALQVEAVLYNKDSQPIECGISYYHHEHYKYYNIGVAGK